MDHIVMKMYVPVIGVAVGGNQIVSKRHTFLNPEDAAVITADRLRKAGGFYRVRDVLVPNNVYSTLRSIKKSREAQFKCGVVPRANVARSLTTNVGDIDNGYRLNTLAQSASMSTSPIIVPFEISKRDRAVLRLMGYV